MLTRAKKSLTPADEPLGGPPARAEFLAATADVSLGGSPQHRATALAATTTAHETLNDRPLTRRARALAATAEPPLLAVPEMTELILSGLSLSDITSILPTSKAVRAAARAAVRSEAWASSEENARALAVDVWRSGVAGITTCVIDGVSDMPSRDPDSWSRGKMRIYHPDAETMNLLGIEQDHPFVTAIATSDTHFAFAGKLPTGIFGALNPFEPDATSRLTTCKPDGTALWSQPNLRDVNALRFSLDGRRLAVATTEVRILDAASGEALATLDSYVMSPSPVQTLWSDHDNALMLSSLGAESSKAWHAPSTMVWLSDSEMLIGSADSSLRHWHLAGTDGWAVVEAAWDTHTIGPASVNYRSQRGPITLLDYQPEAALVATATTALNSPDPHDNKTVKLCVTLTTPVAGLGFTGRSLLAILGDDSKVHLYTHTTDILVECTGLGAPAVPGVPPMLAVSGSILALASTDGDLKIWHLHEDDPACVDYAFCSSISPPTPLSTADVGERCRRAKGANLVMQGRNTIIRSGKWSSGPPGSIEILRAVCH